MRNTNGYAIIALISATTSNLSARETIVLFNAAISTG